jgi:hypothetical protein
MATNQEKTAKETKVSDRTNAEQSKPEKASLCTICGKAATRLVDGEPSCVDRIEQVYEHQVEDYTRAHLVDNEWRKA